MINDFIKSQTEGYDEKPDRKDVAKGDSIGFGRKKIHSAILTGIVNWDQKEIAEEAGVSYGLLRVWRTQSEYQAKEKEFRKKFVKMFVEGFNAYRKDPEGKGERLVDTIVSVHDDVIDEISKGIPQNDRPYFQMLKNASDGRGKAGLRFSKNGIGKMLKDVIENPNPDPIDKKLVIDILKHSSGK